MSRAWEWHRVHIVVGSGRTMLLRAQERCRGLGDGACKVDGITDLGQGRWQHIKGLDRGWERRCGGSEEDSTMMRRLQGGLNDSMASGEVNNGTGSMEFFSGKY
jgi:hypothetical protein